MVNYSHLYQQKLLFIIPFFVIKKKEDIKPTIKKQENYKGGVLFS